MRILITGSQGTLGRVLWRELESRNHEVFGIDLKHSDRPNEMRADIGDSRQVERAFINFAPEMVYHLAAEFGRNNGEEYPEQLWRTNCLGTRNVTDACVSYEASFVFASSSEAYGERQVLDDDDGSGLKENELDHDAPAFHNEYALSKWANERQIAIAANNRDLRAVILRFFNAYGPGEHYSPYRSVVCLFIYRLMMGLPITVYRNYHRVFMYVDDWARTVANVTTAHHTIQYGRPSLLRNVPVYNVGGEEYCSVEELKDKIVHLLGGTKSPICYLDKEQANVTNKRPNISVAREVLGHNPSITLDVGLPETIRWMRKTYLPFQGIAENAEQVRQQAIAGH